MSKNEQADAPKNTWLKRKMIRLAQASSDSWRMGKQGFTMGCTVGAILGAILGSYESYRAKSILPLPLAMLTMAGFFGGIMGVSTLIRTENDDIVMFRVIYTDDKLNIVDYKFIEKESFFNKRI
jgi:hypothetical protein